MLNKEEGMEGKVITLVADSAAATGTGCPIRRRHKAFVYNYAGGVTGTCTIQGSTDGRKYVAIDTATGSESYENEFPWLYVRGVLGTLTTADQSAAIARVGDVATVTAAAHGFSVGDYVEIAGAEQEEYNGLHQVTAKEDNTFDFVVEDEPVTPATGTITATGGVVIQMVV